MCNSSKYPQGYDKRSDISYKVFLNDPINNEKASECDLNLKKNKIEMIFRNLIKISFNIRKSTGSPMIDVYVNSIKSYSVILNTFAKLHSIMI